MSPKRSFPKPDQRALTSDDAARMRPASALDLIAARSFLQRAEAELEAVVEGDDSQVAVARALAEIGSGYAGVAGVVRMGEQHDLNLARVAGERAADLQRLADQRVEDIGRVVETNAEQSAFQERIAAAHDAMKDLASVQAEALMAAMDRDEQAQFDAANELQLADVEQALQVAVERRETQARGEARSGGPVITETPETAAPVAPGATNAPPPVSGDDQNISGELRAALAGALNGVGVARFRNIVEVGAPWTLDDVADDLAEALIAEGWRMPIECDGSRGCAAVVHGEGCFVLAMSAGGAQ